MASKDKTSPLDALSLLVDAANAQSATAQLSTDSKGVKEEKAAEANRAAFGLQHQRAAEMEFREALQRQALEREAHEREAMLQQRAAQFGALGGWMNGGLQFQEAEYMQQLRLEALVQQRRQETIAQLAMAQEYNMTPEVQGAMGFQQLRQAAMHRVQELMSQGGGGAGHHALEQVAALRGRNVPESENPLLRFFEQRDRQQKLAAQGAPAAGTGHDIPPSSVNPEPVSSAPKPSGSTAVAMDKTLSLAGSKVSVLPCRARGMPMDHNAKTAYFVIPDDIKHGAELVCSYNACRNAGTKFRYCVHCSLPVAKRNFFKRHKHGGKIPTERLVDGLHKDDDEISSSDGESKKPIKKKFKKWDPKKLLDKLVEQNAAEVTVDNKAQPKSKATSSGEMAHLVETRKKEWEALLGKRPRSKNLNSMAKWVQTVLAISDLTDLEEKSPMEEKATENGTTEKKLDEQVSAKDSAVEDDASSGNTIDDEADVSSVEKTDKSKMEEDGNSTDGSISSSDGSVDLRAHKKLKAT